MVSEGQLVINHDDRVSCNLGESKRWGVDFNADVVMHGLVG